MTGHPSAIPADVLSTIASMREAGMHFDVIAQATGIHRKTCEYHAIRLGAFKPGIVLHTARRSKYLRHGNTIRGFTAIEDEQITRWSMEGVSLSEMGRRLGRKHNSILNRLRTLARREALAELAE